MARPPLTPPVAGPSALPTYTPKTKDAISRVAAITTILPDPNHPARRTLTDGLDLKKDSCRIYAFAEGGIMLAPQDVLHDSVDEQEVSRPCSLPSVAPYVLDLCEIKQGPGRGK